MTATRNKTTIRSVALPLLLWLMFIPGSSDAEVHDAANESRGGEDVESDSDDVDNERSGGEQRARAPNIIIGGAIGYAQHFGKTSQVDAVTGASTQIAERDFNDPGVALGVFADFGLINAGPGNIGLTTTFFASMPHVYLEVGLSLRYRMRFRTNAGVLRAVEPYIGFGGLFAFDGGFDWDYYFIIGPSIGCEFELFVPSLYLGLGFDINVVNPVGHSTNETVGGTEYTMERRMDDVIGVIKLSYRFL